VRGSDQRAGDATRKLEALGITVVIGHAAGNVGDAQLVVYTSAAHRDIEDTLFGPLAEHLQRTAGER
jgi:UDP-N-acetylmuramate--alanine ligase